MHLQSEGGNATLRQNKTSARTLGGAPGNANESNRNLGRGEGLLQSREVAEQSKGTQILLNNNQTQKNQTDI